MARVRLRSPSAVAEVDTGTGIDETDVGSYQDGACRAR